MFLAFIFSTSVFAEDFFDDYTGIEHAWDGQKPITDTEFEQAINTLTEKQKKKEEDRKSTRLNSSHSGQSRMPSSA